MIESLSQLVSTFFGLISDDSNLIRSSLFTQIHQIVFHGNGGYDWHTVYNMPIWLRRFTFQQMQNHYAEEKAMMENKGKSGNKTLVNSDGKINTPEFLQASQQYKKVAKYK